MTGFALLGFNKYIQIECSEKKILNLRINMNETDQLIQIIFNNQSLSSSITHTLTTCVQCVWIQNCDDEPMNMRAIIK